MSVPRTEYFTCVNLYLFPPVIMVYMQSPALGWIPADCADAILVFEHLVILVQSNPVGSLET